MFYRAIGLGALALILANAGVLVLFFVHDVTLFQLVLVYWCECAWIGVFSAVKLTVASVFGDPYQNRWADVSPGASVFSSLFVIMFSGSAFITLLGFSLMAILFANDVLALSSPGDDMMNHIGLVLGTSSLLLTAHALSFVRHSGFSCRWIADGGGAPNPLCCTVWVNSWASSLLPTELAGLY